MDTPDDQKLPLETERKKSGKLGDSPPRQDEPIREFTGLEKSGTNRVIPPLTEEKRERFHKEYRDHVRSYEFYLEYGLKAVAVFYAVIGGILSIYFSRNRQVNRSVIQVLLGLPILMSGILGGTFLWGAYKWCKMSKHVKRLARRLGIHRTPDIVLLTYLLLIFGSLYILTGGALWWLMWQLKVD